MPWSIVPLATNFLKRGAGGTQWPGLPSFSSFRGLQLIAALWFFAAYVPTLSSTLSSPKWSDCLLKSSLISKELYRKAREWLHQNQGSGCLCGEERLGSQEAHGGLLGGWQHSISQPNQWQHRFSLCTSLNCIYGPCTLFCTYVIFHNKSKSYTQSLVPVMWHINFCIEKNEMLYSNMLTVVK